MPATRTPRVPDPASTGLLRHGAHVLTLQLRDPHLPPAGHRVQCLATWPRCSPPPTPRRPPGALPPHTRATSPSSAAGRTLASTPPPCPASCPLRTGHGRRLTAVTAGDAARSSRCWTGCRCRREPDGVESLAIDPSDPDRIYLATGTYNCALSAQSAPCFRARATSCSFEARRRPSPGGNEGGRAMASALAVDPNDGCVFLPGSRNDGLVAQHGPRRQLPSA